MKTITIFSEKNITAILVENSALNGVKRIADTISSDIKLVTEQQPLIINELSKCTGEALIIAATVGNSDILARLSSDNKVDLAELNGKNECYTHQILEQPFSEFPNIQKVFLIAGSDKRGTIYGMFHLSELCGVSPLVYWGDALPKRRQKLEVSLEKAYLSKEPSVMYRGFFINDEKPAFEGWCYEKFGDANTKAYEKIFELLLRLKGNYLWPAMWGFSFWEQGPGIDNARLADEYGVLIGSSHHEPLCRAGREWQVNFREYGEDPTWSFVSNSDAITNFWRDGLERSKDFEKVITIGMRGESDSKLLGENATFQDNVDVLKKAVITQKKLFKETLNVDFKQVPCTLAIYKEVEDYYTGIGNCEGLRSWSELEDVIIMYCDDNHGNMRSLPTLEEAKRQGGFGMYYHFDYHGSPISYEWTNCNNLAKIWEQMTLAYEHGVQKLWVVNIGDIKLMEYPLSFFMNLAYDYEKWGINNLNSAAEFTGLFLETQFGDRITKSQSEDIRTLMNDYLKWNGAKKPESLNPDVYQNHYHEIDRVWSEANNLMELANKIRSEISEECLPAYDSMVYYPAITSLNVLLLNLEASRNMLHAKRGTLIANQYGENLRQRIELDDMYIRQFHSMSSGKWNHMMDSAHICFRTWCDNDWTYPIVHQVVPIKTEKIFVSFRGDNVYNLGKYWQDKAPILNTEMTRPDCNEVIVDIDSRGNIDFTFDVQCNSDWLSCSPSRGNVCLNECPRSSITFYCSRSKLKGEDTAVAYIYFHFINGMKAKAEIAIQARNLEYTSEHGFFIESQDYISIRADHFTRQYDINGMGLKVIEGLGRTGNALKSFPVTKNWSENTDKPYVEYNFIANNDGEYSLYFYLSPKNPIVKGRNVICCYGVNEDKEQSLVVVSESFIVTDVVYNRDLDMWCTAIDNNIRIAETSVMLRKGKNQLRFYATEPNILLEDIVLCPKDKPVSKTYLPLPESYLIP